MEFVMSYILNFPIKYEYAKATPGDYVVGKIPSAKYMYYGSPNKVIKVLSDISDTTATTNMFAACSNLTTIIPFNMSNVNNMDSMFVSCSSLITIPLLDCQNVKSMSTFFGYSNVNSITNLGGFKDLGKQSSVGGISSGFLDRAPNLTHESLMNVIENLYDRKSNGLSNMSIKLGTTNLAKLTDEEKAIAINKGWNLS